MIDGVDENGGPDMPGWIGAWEIIGSVGSIVVAVFSLMTLQTALSRCSRQNRSLSPGLVWLSLIPIFGLAWLFVVVLAEGRSLGAEFHARGVAAPARPDQSLGLTMAVALVAANVFFAGALVLSYWARAYGDVTYNRAANWQFETEALGIILGLAGLVLLIAYGVNVHRSSSRLLSGPSSS